MLFFINNTPIAFCIHPPPEKSPKLSMDHRGRSNISQNVTRKFPLYNFSIFPQKLQESIISLFSIVYFDKFKHIKVDRKIVFSSLFPKS